MTHEDDLRLREIRAEIKRLDQVLVEREKRIDVALSAITSAGEKSEAESLRSRQAANEWRSAMADRESRFATAGSLDTVKEELGLMRSALSEWQGRRVAWIAAAGIIATLLAIGVGQIIRSGITAADVSNQIQREAPWNRDKDEISRRVARLENDNERLRISISRLQQRDEFFCVTRAAAGLPAC